MDPVQNPAACLCSMNYHPFGSLSPGSNPWSWQAVYGKGRCGFTLRVEAGQCGSNRFSTDIDTKLKSFQKFLNINQKVFSPCRSHGILRNWHGLRCGSMRVDPGRYGFDTVWTRFEIRLCVTVALPFKSKHSFIKIVLLLPCAVRTYWGSIKRRFFNLKIPKWLKFTIFWIGIS